jgi:hypothetical protein
MFCPRCGAQNKTEQKFCRNCGASLTAVRLAIEGKVDEVAATLEKDIERIANGAITLVIFALIALIASFISAGNAVVNLILGLSIGGTLLYKGFKRANRTVKLITPTEAPKALGKGHPVPLDADAVGHKDIAPTIAPDTDPLTPAPAPNVLSEHTTFNLKQPGGQ